MISARQEIDLRPPLERLDALLLRSAGVDPGSLGFEFRPLWQLSAAERAGVALQKAQATAVYAGLNLWPAGVTARLAEAQLVEDGFYPNAEAIFAAAAAGGEGPEGAEGTGAVQPIEEPPLSLADFSPDQPRDPQGRWTSGSPGGTANSGDFKAEFPVSGSPGSGELPIDTVAHFWERERKRFEKRRKHRERERERERELEERHGPAGQSGMPESSEQSLPGNLKRPSMQVLEQAARKAGYTSVEDWKIDELHLNSRSDIVIDKDGNAFTIPRQGHGDPQPLHIEKLK